MKRIPRHTLAFLGFFAVGVGTGEATELRGSRGSMERQHGVAIEHDLAFAKTTEHAQELADTGKLVEVPGNADYDASRVRYPYALPETRTFLERFSAQYRRYTGEKLVVTSLTRPETRQPANAHRLSVHPAGMAIDLRVPKDASARRWIENSLLSLEERGVLDVTREFRPPHYHIAVFPEEYGSYAAEQVAAEAEERARMAMASGIAVGGPAGVLTPAIRTAAPTAPATEPTRPRWKPSLLLLLPIPMISFLRPRRLARTGA